MAILDFMDMTLEVCTKLSTWWPKELLKETKHLPSKPFFLFFVPGFGGSSDARRKPRIVRLKSGLGIAMSVAAVFGTACQ